MKSTITERPAMLLVGMAINVKLGQEGRPGFKLASTFFDRKSEIGSRLNDTDVFGVSTDPENYNVEKDKFEYFIGVEVSDAEHVPEGMVIRKLPANEYVAFRFHGPAENAGAVHAYLYSTWLNENDYELCELYNIEIYGEGFDGPESQESVTDLLFPVKKVRT